MYEVTIGGDDFQLVLRVAGYQFPAIESGYEADWLTAEAEMTVADDDSFRARHAVSLRTDDLAPFRDQLVELLLSGQGVATVSGLGEFRCSVTLSDGKGELAAFIGKPFPGVELRVARVPTDRSYLQATARDLDVLLAALPVRRQIRRDEFRPSSDEIVRRSDQDVLDLRRVIDGLREQGQWGSFTELTPDQLVRKWIATVAIVEVGYDDAWEMYVDDLMTREFIAEVSRRLPDYWAARFAEWVAPWDERFREATIEEPEPHLLRDEEPGWWWFRSPRVWPGRLP